MSWVLWAALLAQGDPNQVYRDLTKPQKERVYLVFERELRARQNLDGALEATSKATTRPVGTVRLIFLELRADGRFAEDRKTGGIKYEKKDDDKPTSRSGRRSGSSSRSSKGANAKRDYSGDGYTRKDGKEFIKLKADELKDYEFVERCQFVLPEEVARTTEEIPIIVDGKVRSSNKDWTVVELEGTDGSIPDPLVIGHLASTPRCENLKRGDRVRLWGWVATSNQMQQIEDIVYDDEDKDKDDDDRKSSRRDEETRPLGLPFFAMALDEYERNVPGLELSCTVTDEWSAGSDKRDWRLEVVAHNVGDRSLVDVVAEASVAVRRRKIEGANESALVYFDEIPPGESRTVSTTIPNWVNEEIDVASVIRALTGDVGR